MFLDEANEKGLSVGDYTPFSTTSSSVFFAKAECPRLSIAQKYPLNKQLVLAFYFHEPNREGLSFWEREVVGSNPTSLRGNEQLIGESANTPSLLLCSYIF